MASNKKEPPKYIWCIRAALADFEFLYYEGLLPDSAKQTIIQLIDFLKSDGESTQEYAYLETAIKEESAQE